MFNSQHLFLPYIPSPVLISLGCKYLKRYLFSWRDPDWFTWPALVSQAFAYALSQPPHPQGQLLVILSDFVLPSPPLWSWPSSSTHFFLKSELGTPLLHSSLITSGLFLETTTDFIFLRAKTLSYSTWYHKSIIWKMCLLNEWLNSQLQKHFSNPDKNNCKLSLGKTL